MKKRLGAEIKKQSKKIESDMFVQMAPRMSRTSRTVA